MIYDISGKKLDTNSSTVISGDIDTELLDPLLPIAKRKHYNGYVNSRGIWINTTTETNKVVVLDVSEANLVHVETPNTRLYFLKTFETPTDGASVVYGDTAPFNTVCVANTNSNYTLTDDINYLVVQVRVSGEDKTPSKIVIDNIDYVLGAREELRSEKFDNGVNWLTLGDSISSGYYSFFKDDGSADSRASGYLTRWNYLVSQINHWNFTSAAVGGMGYVYGNTPTYKTIQNIDFTNYNLVTLHGGINDWKSGATAFGELSDEASATPTTVVSSMKYIFETIFSSNPLIKIIVFTPLNCRGYSYNFGDDSTCWARGHKINGLTLDEFADKMKEVCDLYGIECVDMTRNSCLNKNNMATLLPDGVHPSVECHALLAKEYAKKINFK